MSTISYRVALIRGTGDVGSAVAVMLCRAGYRVVMHDAERPAHTRRGMSLVDALYDGCAELAGMLGKRARSRDDLTHMVRCGRAVPISPFDADGIVDVLRPDVVVDARMRKRSMPEDQRGLAETTIGLGPNFEAEVNVDVAIETAWGDELGAVVRAGKTKPL